MTDYQPTSRRPIANLFRGTAHVATRWCVRRQIHADTVSYMSIFAAGAAAICFWQAGRQSWLLLLAPIFCFVRLWLNMLDGMVALAAHQASPRGEILNDLPDRISDIIIFVGVAHSGLTNPFLGYWAALLSVLTAYVGLLGRAVGAHREFSGVMSKPWRMVALSLGAWLTFFSHRWLIDWALIVIIAGCLQTIAVRLRRIFAALPNK